MTTGFGAASVDYAYDDRDRLLVENAATLAWDANGNMVSHSGDSEYTWDFEDRLVSVAKADGTLVEHTYDANGARVRTTVTSSGTTGMMDYLLDTSGALSHVVVETDVAGAITASYVRAGDQLLAVLRRRDAKQYHADGLGSIRALTVADGSTTDGYGYTAFGEALGWTGMDAQPYRFAGEETRDGLQYHRARWLRPGTGTFLSMDGFGGFLTDPASLHPFGYSSNNPQNRIDPTGRFTSVSDVAMTSAIIGVLSRTVVIGVQEIWGRTSPRSTSDILGDLFVTGVASYVSGGAQATALWELELLRDTGFAYRPILVQLLIRSKDSVIAALAGSASFLAVSTYLRNLALYSFGRRPSDFYVPGKGAWRAEALGVGFSGVLVFLTPYASASVVGGDGVLRLVSFEEATWPLARGVVTLEEFFVHLVKDSSDH